MLSLIILVEWKDFFIKNGKELILMLMGDKYLGEFKRFYRIDTERELFLMRMQDHYPNG